MKELKNLNDLLKHEVQVLYEAEKLQLLALKRMTTKANNAELKDIFQQHLEETKNQKVRLERVAELLKIDPTADVNPSIVGLVAEGELVLHKDATTEALDATLIAGVQKVEHYEIASYGTAATLAEQLGLNEIYELLTVSLSEEKETDIKLSKLAKSKINRKADVVNK
jgi:ferritin-like metal-binding protein YciE